MEGKRSHDRAVHVCQRQGCAPHTRRQHQLDLRADLLWLTRGGGSVRVYVRVCVCACVRACVRRQCACVRVKERWQTKGLYRAPAFNANTTSIHTRPAFTHDQHE